MKVGIFTVLFADKPFEEVLDLVAEAGVRRWRSGAAAIPARRTAMLRNCSRARRSGRPS